MTQGLQFVVPRARGREWSDSVDRSRHSNIDRDDWRPEIGQIVILRLCPQAGSFGQQEVNLIQPSFLVHLPTVTLRYERFLGRASRVS
jgi:hypothetical protein